MQAVVYRRYGAPEAMELVDLPAPTPGPDQVVVRVVSSAVNPVDCHRLRGEPFLVRLTDGLTKPKNQGLGADVAGTVEAVGSDVTNVRPGDEVLGMGVRTWAELVVIKAEGVVAKPPNVSFEQAGAVGVAGITALQGIRDQGHVSSGKRVLVHGAGGGVGTFGVQIAKALGAEVTAVTNTGNLELVRSLGADRVIDYTAALMKADPARYDVIFDAGGFMSLSDQRRALTPDGTAVVAGAGKSPTIVGIAGRMAAAIALNKVGSRRFASYLAHRTQDDLQTLAAMLAAGSIRSVVDRRYAMTDIVDAVRYEETGQARGKVVVTVAAVEA